MNKVFLVDVDYEWTVEYLIRLKGYDFVHPAINSRNFPTTTIGGRQRIQMSLFDPSCLDLKTNAQTVIAAMRLAGLRRPTVLEGLALGAQHFDDLGIQEHAVVILCDPWWDSDGLAIVPSLTGDEYSRWLDTFSYDFFFMGGDSGLRFAGVHMTLIA